MSEKCDKCKKVRNVTIDTTMCCGQYICWEHCLKKLPTKCPFCKYKMKVVWDNLETGEDAYIEWESDNYSK